jgi:hypothetical protein
VLKKTLISGLLLTSSFVALSPVNAGSGFEDEGRTLVLSVKKLKSGYKNEGLIVQGKHLSMKSIGTPNFENPSLDKKMKLSASVNLDGDFNFSYTTPGGPGMKYNEETKEWEPDFYSCMPGETLFDLIVSPVSKKPIVGSTVEELSTPSSSYFSSPEIRISDNIILEKPKEGASPSVPLVSAIIEEAQVPSSMPHSSPVLPVVALESVELDTYGGLGLSLRQLKKGFEAGVLETNLGKFSITQAPYSGSPNFGLVYNDDQKFSAYAHDGIFCFSHYTPGGPSMKFNKETQKWEEDWETPGPTEEVFNLIIKKIQD